MMSVPGSHLHCVRTLRAEPVCPSTIWVDISALPPRAQILEAAPVQITRDRLLSMMAIAC
jgi:hypothetical protein